MSASKRRRSDHDDQWTTPKLRFGESRHNQDQDLDPKAIFPTAFEEFRLVVKLQSTSKAARNDPKPSLSLAELSSRYELESRKDELDNHGTGRSTALEDSQNTPDHDLGFSDAQEEVSINQAGASTYQGEEEGSQKQLTSKGGTSLQRDNAVEMKVDSTATDTSHNFRRPLSSICSQDEDDEERSDEEQIDENSFDDDDCSESYSDLEFAWMEGIDVTITSLVNQDEHGEPEIAGYCNAKLIRRNQIRHDFYAELEQPTNQTGWLAFDLFDRYGRLRSEFSTHPIIKGTGVWNREVDRGDILLIELIYVKKARRRQQLGRRMVEALLQVTLRKTRSFIAFSLSSLLKLHDISQEFHKLKDDIVRDEMEDRERDRAIAFHRSLGFRRVGNSRWFAMTTDHEHPSRKLASTEDIDPLERSPSTLHPLLQPFQQITDPSRSSNQQLLDQQPPEDPDLLGALQNCVQKEGLTSTCWTSTDEYGNNLLHLALKIMDAACVEWILKQDFGPQLLELRNYRGETPMESLVFHLEKLRVQRTIPSFTASISDEFTGHSKTGVLCLGLLQGFPDLESFAKAKGFHALQKLIEGCTCGRCIEGVLSPRMSHALHTQADIGYNMLQEHLGNFLGSEWVNYNYHHLRFVSAKLRGNLATNKSVRTGFVNLWSHIASCLERNRLPNERNVLEGLQIDREWPPATKNFLRKGGTVESVFLAVCDAVMSQDEWIGDGEYAEMCGDDIAKLPECRNDREFGFVSGTCGYKQQFRVHEESMIGDHLDEEENSIDFWR